MFTFTQNNFDQDLVLTNRVSNDYFTDKYVAYFDNDGFELSYLEQEYYREHNIQLTNILNHLSNQLPWIECSNPHFKIDHSTISQRWSFEGQARIQLINQVHKFPELLKYLNLKPKWGLDFALEYYKQDNFIEVIHFEMDYDNYEQAIKAKQFYEEKIVNTDWELFVAMLLSCEEEWSQLKGMEQNDWKAKMWGLDKAEVTLKTWGH